MLGVYGSPHWGYGPSPSAAVPVRDGKKNVWTRPHVQSDQLRRAEVANPVPRASLR